MRATFVRLIASDDGQDLLEYALLVAFVGVALLAVFLALQDAFATAYANLDSNEQSLSAVTPNPW